VFVNVTDTTGAIVGGLTREDFCPCRGRTAAGDCRLRTPVGTALNLTLAIDTSGSVHKDLLLEQDAARRFVRAMMRPQTR